MNKILTFILFCFVTSSTSGQHGLLDLTFGSGGKALTYIGNSNVEVHDMALMNNDDIVMVGRFWNNPMSWDFFLAKYKSNGSLDPTFGTGGILIHGGSGDEVLQAVCIQKDGKILAAGSQASPYKFAVVRYLSNGTLDNSFGTAGIASTLIGISAHCYDIALHNDGKIVLGGYSVVNTIGDLDFALARFDSSGIIDNSFGLNGRVTTSFGAYAKAYGNSLIIQPDEKIILSGKSYVARYNKDGSLDITFGDGGKLIYQYESYCSSLQPDGKILISGAIHSMVSENNFVIARHLPNGWLDNTFGTGGIVITELSESNDCIYSTALEHDGEIVSCGDVNTGLSAVGGYGGIIRYNSLGIIDSTFGNDGTITNPFDSMIFLPRKVIIQRDRKILIGGFCNDRYLSLIRYQGDYFGSKPEVELFPNPADMFVTIIVNRPYSNLRFTFYNECGQAMLSHKMSSKSTTVDVHNLPHGFYTILFETQDTRFAKKLIII